MPLYEFEGKKPKIHPDAYVHPSAELIGDVTISAGTHVAPGAVLRADFGTIVVGPDSSVEDNCVFHCRPDDLLQVGAYVTVGHGSILHTCIVRSYAIIGSGCVVTDYAEVGRWTVLAEGSVVKTRDKIPPKKLAAGVPARVLRDLPERVFELWSEYKKVYPECARVRYKKYLKELAPRDCLVEPDSGCPVCGGELEQAESGECLFCGKESEKLLKCALGHFVCPDCVVKGD